MVVAALDRRGWVPPSPSIPESSAAPRPRPLTLGLPFLKAQGPWGTESVGLRVVSMVERGAHEAWGAPRAPVASLGSPSRPWCRPHVLCVPQDPLLRVQEVLNGTEVNLQHLTALVDCRSLHLVRAPGGPGPCSWGPGPCSWGPGPCSWGPGPCGWGRAAQNGGSAHPQSSSLGAGRGWGQARHPILTLPPSLSSGPCGPGRLRPRRPQDYVQALTGFCYDGVEGLIYLALFSFVTALMFSSIVCSVPHTWQQKR